MSTIGETLSHAAAHMRLVRETLRLLPDFIRLLRRLAADRELPRGVRICVGLLIAYLLVHPQQVLLHQSSCRVVTAARLS